MQYTVILPTGTRNTWAPALCPAMNIQGQAYQSRGRVFGGPIQGVPAPAPEIAQNVVGQALMGQSRSIDAPNAIYPSEYFTVSQEFAPIGISNPGPNIMPIPAVRPPNVIAAQPFAARIGGDRQIFQPQVVPVWLGTAGSVYG